MICLIIEYQLYLLINSSYYISIIRLNMNNLKNMLDKAARNGLETNILKQVKSTFPNVEQYISAHRYPVLPKIVLYSSSANSEAYLRKYLQPFIKVIPPIRIHHANTHS